MFRMQDKPARLALVVALVAAIFVACAEPTPLGPDAQSTLPMLLSAPLGAGAAAAASMEPDLGACPQLQVSADSKLAYHVFAVGVQIYRWNGTAWAFVAPEALIYADAAWNGVVGTHYAGPTWESNSGSKVVGTVLERCTPDPGSIQWLKLGAVSTTGPGVFDRVQFILRVNTVAGLAPSYQGGFVGELARMPYTTEYYFYR